MRIHTGFIVVVLLATSCAQNPAHSDELFQAIEKGQIEKVRSIIQADPRLAKTPDKSGVTPILFSVYHQKPDAAKAMIDAGAQPDLAEAAALGDEARVRELIAKDKAAISGFSRDGFTPLHLAVFFGHPRAAALLLENGADVNARLRNAANALPLQSAAAAKRQDMAELLIKYHADVNVRGEGGYSPLHEVASNGQIEFAQLLLAHGAEINVRGDDGRTPLVVARDEKQNAMATFLSQKGGR